MIIISPKILAKIGGGDHGAVTEREVRECFMVWDGRYCEDPREQHQTQSGLPTRWFVCESHVGRSLKIMYVEDDENVYLKTAYVATEDVQRIFAKHVQN
jgi:hypothetical protein